MKKYVMNKAVMHGGKVYASGMEIKEGDPGFKDIVEKGHATVMNFADGGEAPAAPVVEEAAPEVMEEKPAPKKGRKG